MTEDFFEMKETSCAIIIDENMDMNMALPSSVNEDLPLTIEDNENLLTALGLILALDNDSIKSIIMENLELVMNASRNEEGNVTITSLLHPEIIECGCDGSCGDDCVCKGDNK
jgi:hypothetical protein